MILLNSFYQFVNDAIKEYVRVRGKDGNNYFMLHPNVYKNNEEKPESNNSKSLKSIIDEWKQKVDKDLVMIGGDLRFKDEIKNKIEEDKLYLERLIAEADQQREVIEENPDNDIEEKINQAIINARKEPPVDLPEELQEELIESMKDYNDYFHNPNNKLRGEYFDDLIEQLNNSKKNCCLMKLNKDTATWLTVTDFFEEQEDTLLSKLLEFDPVIEKHDENYTLIKFKREVFDQNKEKIEKIQHQYFARANSFTDFDFDLDFKIVSLTKDEHNFIVSNLKKHAIISSNAEPEFKGFFRNIVQYAPELENEDIEYIFEITDKCLPTSVKNRL